MVGELRDRVTGESLSVLVNFENGVLFIRPEGHGDFESEDGGGYPLMLELLRGSVNMVVYGNINQPDPTNVISLDLSKETLRKSGEET